MNIDGIFICGVNIANISKKIPLGKRIDLKKKCF